MVSNLSPWKPINVCWNTQNRAHFAETINLRITCLGLLLKWMFSHLSPWKPINVCWNTQNRSHFAETINLRDHMPRFTLKIKTINLRGHIPRFTLKWTFSHLSSRRPHKCVLKHSEQGSFSWDNQFEGSHTYVYPENECFPIYLLGNHINVCWNPQNRAQLSETIDLRGHINRAQFSEMIDLRGHMPRFTLKMNIFPSIF